MRADRTLWWIDPEKMSRDSEQEGPPPGRAVSTETANLVSSLLEDGRHSPVLDLDFEARLVPSRTPGHFHLYLDGLDLTWEEYEKLLGALIDARVIGPHYGERSIYEGMTVVRREGTFTTRTPTAPLGTPAEAEDPF